MEECAEKLRAKNTELEGKIAKLFVENERLRSGNYSIESELRDVKRKRTGSCRYLRIFQKAMRI